MQPLQAPKKTKSKLIWIVASALITFSIVSAHYLDSNATKAQETYPYFLETPQHPEVVSDTFRKSEGGQPTLTVGTGITQTVTIGKPRFRLYGWAPVESTVKATGIGVSQTTTADASGYFEFANLYLPLPRYSGLLDAFALPEICLQASVENTLTQPTCLAPMESDLLVNEIGPVLLSPTLNVEKNVAEIGDQIVAKGKTTPNTNVQIHLAKRDFPTLFQIIKVANAAWLPEYEIVSDDQGNFEFTLPTSTFSSWKLFATATVQSAPTPKGTTLNFLVANGLLLSILGLISRLSALGRYIFPILVGLEILLIVILAWLITRDRGSKRHTRSTLRHS